MNRFKIGDIVKHFKRELVKLRYNNTDPNMHLYIILGEAIDPFTEKSMVIYKALYGNHTIYVRPVDEFESEIDDIRYPNIKQKYIFEKIDGSVV